MKVKITYDLTNDLDALDYRCTRVASDIVFILQEFLMNGHRKFEHNDSPELEGIYEAQKILREELQDSNINIENF